MGVRLASICFDANNYMDYSFDISVVNVDADQSFAPSFSNRWVRPHHRYSQSVRNSKRFTVTTKGFVASHAAGAAFERGLRSFYEYRDLGIKAATDGKVAAHVIRAAQGAEFSSQPHMHKTTFQLVYILKGWIEFEYEGQGVVRLEAGSCVHQPPEIRHRELGHSEDIEMLEIVLPGNFTTEQVTTI